VIPLRPLGVGEILDGAIATTRLYWRAILGVTFVVALVTKGIEIVVQGKFIDDTRLKNLQDESNPSVSDILHAISGSLAGFALVMLVALVGVLVTTAILTTVIGRAVLGQPITAGEAWRRARPQMPRLLGLTFLVPLIVALIMAVCLLPGVLVALAGSESGGGALATIGLLAGLVIAIRLWVQLSLAAPALMLEKQDIVSAMKRSAKLVNGSWWRVLGMQLLAGILVYLVSTIIQLPFALIGAGVTGDSFGNLLSADSNVSWTYLIISGIGGVIAATITLPITSGVLTLLYMDQRIRRESLDIDLARAAGV
jgi:hypothetical protein